MRHKTIMRMYLGLADQKGLPNAAYPKTINDKFIWRKLFDRNPDFPIIADKIGVRDWVADKGIKVDFPPLVWTGDNPEDIPDEFWRPGFVVKANHGSGWNYFLTDPMPDRSDVNARLNRALDRMYGEPWYERHYYEIPRRVMVEEMIPNAAIEMKFHTNGTSVERVLAVFEREALNLADIWEVDENGELYLTDEIVPRFDGRAGRPIPAMAKEALGVAREIGAYFDYMRVDFLSDGNRFWLGELTVTNMGGHLDGDALSSQDKITAAWDLRKSWFLSTEQKGWRALYARILKRRLDAAAA